MPLKTCSVARTLGMSFVKMAAMARGMAPTLSTRTSRLSVTCCWKSSRRAKCFGWKPSRVYAVRVGKLRAARARVAGVIGATRS